MKWLLRVLFAPVGAVVGLVRLRQPRPVYPTPESLVMHLPDDVPDRVLLLEGAVNFRDVGGYTTADGRRVRRGLVYRSATLSGLTDDDVSHLGELGVKLVCDLRGLDEVAEEPDRLTWQPAPTYLHLPLAVEDDRRRRLTALLFRPNSIAPMLAEMYTRVMIDGNAHVYGQVLRHLTAPANLPAVIHCTAGKDRTGVAVALLLSLFGVPDEVIAADYSLSNAYYDTFFAYGERVVRQVSWLGVRAADLQPFFMADPATIRTALAYIREGHGSTQAYLREAAGLTDAEIVALRENFLE